MRLQLGDWRRFILRGTSFALGVFVILIAWRADESGLLALLALTSFVGVEALRFSVDRRLRMSLERRDRALRMLNSIGDQLSGGASLDRVLWGVYQRVHWLTGSRHFYIALYDAERDTVDFPLVVRDGQKIAWPERRQTPGFPAEHVITSRRMLSADRVELLALGLEPGPEMPIGHYLGLPLMVDVKVLGMMALLDYRRSADPDEKQAETLQTLAVQSALIIRNASLYDRNRELWQNLYLMNRSIQDVMFNLDSEMAMQAACQIALGITKATKAAIFLSSEESRSQLRLAQSAGLPQDMIRLYEDPAYVPRLHGLETNQISDVAMLPADDPMRRMAQAGGFHSLIEICLRSGGSPVGLMIIYRDAPYVYDNATIGLLEALAHQVTAALDNAELLKALELYASEQAQLVHLSRISTSSLNLETVIDRVSTILCQMMNVARVRIGLLQPDNGHLRLFDQSGGANDLNVDEVPELLAMRQKTLPSPRIYYQQDGGLSQPLADLMAAAQDETLALVPMLANDRLLGVIALSHPQPRYFSDGEWRLVELATNQIATQLHNAQQFEVTHSALNRRLQQLSLIEDIARQIARAFDIDQLIRKVLEATLTSTGGDFAALGLLTETGEFRTLELERAQDSWTNFRDTYEARSGLLGRVVATGQTLIVPDNQLAADYVSASGSVEYRSSLLVPLLLDEKVIGALNVESVRPNYFTQEQATFVQSLAGHAVISIQNARLLQERQTQIETLISLRDLSLRLSSDANRASVTTGILRTALDIMQGENAVLFHYHAETDEVALLGSMKYDGASHVSSRTFLPDAVAFRAVRTASTYTIQDVRQSEEYRNYPHLKEIDYTGVIAAPIMRGNQVKEVICVTLARSRPLMPGDVNTIELLAIQAAGHLENTDLYDRIQTNNNRMSAILDSTRDGIIMLDRGGQLIQANAAAERILGLDLDQYVGEHFAQMLIEAMQVGGVSDTDDQEALTEMARILRLEPERITNRSFEVRKGGTVRYIEEVGSPVYDAHYMIVGRLLTLRDVTEEHLLAAYRDEISNMVVHDLRGPLGAIISSLTLSNELIGEIDAPIVPTVLTTLGVSLDSAANLLNMVDSLLDIAKLETRRMPLRPAPADLGELAHNAFLTLSTSIQEAQLIVDIVMPGDLPKVNVDGDKIRRVLINLLDNAVRFTPTGGRIEISGEYLARANRVVVRVADSGRGIPPEETERVFEKFRQVKDHQPARGRKGSGLGLTFCKLAIEAHGERIWIEKHPALSGACFTFTLPVISADGTGESSPEARTPQSETPEV